MSDEPIRVDSRAWTGDLDVAPVKTQTPIARSVPLSNREKFYFRCSLAAFGGMLLATPIDLLAWSINGNPPYFGGSDASAWLVGLAIMAGFSGLFILIGRRKWLPWVPLLAILGASLFSCGQYLQASAARTRLETTSFYVGSLDLRRSSRTGSGRRFRASAELYDRDGNSWRLHGNYDYIAQLLGQECFTAAFRVAGNYRFVVGNPTLLAIPDVYNATYHRDPARCFAASPPLP